MNTRLFLQLGCALAAGVAATMASPIVPNSYTATPGQGQAYGGTYNYFDETGRQLIDGEFGVSQYNAAESYQWVGWLYNNPTLVFDFGQVVTIGSVSIDFNRHEEGGIYLPSGVQVDGDYFSVNRFAFPDKTTGTVNFEGLWTGQKLTVNLVENGSGWIFVDEVQFTTAVPEPSTVALGLMGAAILGGFQWLKRK